MIWLHTCLPADRHISALNMCICTAEIFMCLMKNIDFWYPNQSLCFYVCLFACFWWMLSTLRALWALSKCTHWRTRFMFEFTRSIWYNDLWRSHALLATKSLQQGKATNHLWYNEAQQVSQGTTHTSAGHLSWSVFPSKHVTS